MADIFDEVESDYRADQLRAVALRYAWVAVAAFVLLLAAVGGTEWWQARRHQAELAAAGSYLALDKQAASLVAGDQPSRIALAARYADFARTTSAGYRTLARLQQAALLADGGRLADAQAVWDAIAADPQAPPLLRRSASLLWVQRGLDSADPAALRTRLVSLMATDSPYRFAAMEAQALLDLRLNQPDPARLVLRRLSADPATPDGIRARAGALLSRLGN